MKRVLVVDDERSMCEMLGIMLRKEGFDVAVAESRTAATAHLARNQADLVITDVRLPDGDGIEILRHVKAVSPETVVIVMTAFGSTETAVAALKLGAQDYLIKPFDIDELKIVVRNAFEREQLRQENLLLRTEFRAQHGLDSIVGKSPAMAAMFDLVRTVARTGSTVLISGESGTGKELVAKAIHTLSARRDAPFVSVNCGALPETLLESELFGHMKGSFTDAHQNRKGLFEAAHRGTLFLDEVGETPASMQVKLLRVLQEKRVRRVGDTAEVEVDVRIISATNRPLDALVKDGQLREDLYYRLCVIPIAIPPLRERLTDIPLLAEHFVRRFGLEMGKSVREVSPEAMLMLERHVWPGNVRELENVMERAVALETASAVQVDRLPESVRLGRQHATHETALGPGFSLEAHVREVEAGLVRKALERAAWDRARACDLLGLTPRSLRYLIRKYGIERAS